MDTPEGRGTVVEVDLLRSRVKVRLEDQPETITVVKNEELAVLRSGKAKKNDPPIPADLAPISGSGKRVRKEVPEEPAVFLDSIKFRYSSETIADQTQSEEVAEESGEEPKRSRRRGRRKPQRSKEQSEAQQEAPKPEKPVEKVPEDGEKAKKPHNNHRRRNHRRRPKGSGEAKQGE